MFDFDQKTIEKLLEDSVAEICRHENFSRFLRWMQERMGVRRKTLFSPGTEEDMPHLATLLALAIWNVVPLPGQGFQVKKIAFPDGNQACLCGSGKKFINCCDVDLLSFDPLDCNVIWPLVFENIPAGVTRDGLVKNLIPLDGRIHGAISCLEKGRPKKALSFLEAVFSPKSIAEVGDSGAFAFSLLLDAYDMLGFGHKKRQTIAHVVASVPASPLRSEAYQQLAAMQMDQGQIRESWISFRKAQIDSPDDCKVGMLEIQLLLAEQRFDRARERAGFLLKRMKKQGLDDDFSREFLEEVVSDPRKGRLRIEFARIQDMGLELVDWLEKVARRPLPEYLCREPGKGRLSREIRDVRNYALTLPAAVRDCEEDWDDVCPADFAGGAASGGALWQPDADFGWIDFLCRRPESFDSLSILEDVIRILDLHPNRELSGFNDGVLEPILQRLWAIIERIIAGIPVKGHLPWSIPHNRSFLRITGQYILQLLQDGEMEEFFRLAERVLEINPNDEQGVRTGLVNCYLDMERYQQALAVCRRYPNDMLVDILYGRALALFCLEDAEACHARKEAVEKLPLAAEYLLAGRVRVPEARESAESWDAYSYRDEMLPVWKASRKALKWLKEEYTSPSRRMP